MCVFVYQPYRFFFSKRCAKNETVTKNEYKTAKCGDAYKLMFDSYAFNWAAMGLENAGAKAKKKRVKDKDGDCEYLRYVHKVTHVQSHVNQIRKNIVRLPQ